MDKSDPMTPAPQDQSLDQLELPEWLTPATTPTNPDPAHTQLVAQGKQDRLALLQQQYEFAFDRVIDRIAAGNPLSAALEGLPYQFEYGKYIQWILKDENRRQRYYEAQETGAEIVADQMLNIADADDSLEDVARSTLRINTRKWLLGVWNRKRYGETKQIEQNVTINLTDAMAEAHARLDNMRTVEVQGRVIDG
jgi:hypothetical protein